MSDLPPWANGPFELLLHAEGHLLDGNDFDRRIALISFDNAIEVTITTYLTLDPIMRGSRTYPKIKVDGWLSNFFTKLDFLEAELKDRKVKWAVDKSHIVWSHTQRNEQYHGGQKGTPEKATLALGRSAALWIFSILFEVSDVEERLARAIVERKGPAPQQRVKEFDRAIDEKYGMIEVGHEVYYASEVLFFVDAVAYRTVGQRLCDERNIGMPFEDSEV